MSNFKIGQEIVCIKSHSLSLFKKGDEFVIQGIKKEKCCNTITLDIGLKFDFILARCVCGKETEWDNYFGSSLFVPKQELSNTTYNEVMEWIANGNPIEQLN